MKSFVFFYILFGLESEIGTNEIFFVGIASKYAAEEKELIVPAVVCFKCGFLDLTGLSFSFSLASLFSFSLVFPIFSRLRISILFPLLIAYSVDTYLCRFVYARFLVYWHGWMGSGWFYMCTTYTLSVGHWFKSQCAFTICHWYLHWFTHTQIRKLYIATGDKVRKRL